MEKSSNLTFVLVGDSNSGKTQLLISYMAKFYPNERIISNFENYKVNLQIDSKPYCLQLYDADSSEDKKNERQQIYHQADVFIVCFSLVSPPSLENVTNIWLPEINQFAPNKPFILCGVKSVLRDSYNDRVDEFEKNGWVPVPTEKGETVKTRVGAKIYIECGPKNDLNVKEVFESTIKVYQESKESENNDASDNACCQIC